MGDERALVQRHIRALIEEADASRVPRDVLGRMLLSEVTELWQKERPWQDVANELRFVADNLDPDADFEFSRP